MISGSQCWEPGEGRGKRHEEPPTLMEAARRLAKCIIYDHPIQAQGIEATHMQRHRPQ